jgi:fructose-1,6-bisphosphatase I/sedoheptulose-1,7-bisphosphatase
MSAEVAAEQVTLTRWLACQRLLSQPDGHLRDLLAVVGRTVAAISDETRRGALAGVLGDNGVHNVQGEAQKHLDVISHHLMVDSVGHCGHVAGLVSEEAEDVLPAPVRSRGPYLLVFDPLDGSSNVDVNLSVGTIFSVLRHRAPGRDLKVPDFLQPGTDQVCAGFAVYGPSTTLVLTVGDGSHGFTLEPGTGDFVLTHPWMTVPAQSREFAINASNERFWEPPVRRYVQDCLAGCAGPRGRDFNMRWVASLVAETYRILTRGGVFLYPRDTKEPGRRGRLRLLYEANPIAFVVEQAGGLASTGGGRVLDLQPRSLHQRVPLIFGSAEEVELIERYHGGSRPMLAVGSPQR